MANTLVIVESPSKAKTIAKYLGKGYTVESSIGHIRDLPRSAAEIPAQYKDKAWSRLGLDVEHDFAPIYVVSSEKKSQVAKLKSLLKGSSEVILATDDDREGESIAWHLQQELKPKVPVRRMVFHEITAEAIRAAIASPRAIDTHLVEAQETRRALDRLYGYEVSPVLWKKIAPKLSAGRVQSVATRMLVERERERMGFTPASYWGLEARIRAGEEKFPANVLELESTRIATGKDFDESGKLKPSSKVVILAEKDARELADSLRGQTLEVISLEEKPFTQRPYAPFITSTLQQEGGRKLGFAAQRTMRTAQRLYEGGYITYMRTDSTTLSKEAMSAARGQVRSMYGEEYLHPTPRTYDKKAKNAQEAHEAIRPAGSSFRTPDSLRGELGDDEWKLYDLIWKRTVASQMADARGKRTSVRMSGAARDGRKVILGASGQVIEFPGFLRAYVEGSDDPDAALEGRDIILPALKVGQKLDAEKVEPKGHTTQPPARYTEASLVQALEGAGIGRPSTYANILSTIQDRGYVVKKGSALVPTWTGFATVQLLEQHFPNLVNYDFTARMEEDLDEIAGGRQGRVKYLTDFYSGADGLRSAIDSRLGEIDAIKISTIPTPRLGNSGIEVRVGRFGAYLKREESKANLPPDLLPDDLTLEKAEELLSNSGKNDTLGDDPETLLPVIAKAGRFGPYVQLGEETPPVRTASLFPSDKLEELTLERALELLKIPRMVGISEGEEVWAFNGRYGPYLKRGDETRNLGGHEALLTISLEETEVLFRQPAQRRGRGPSQSVVQTFEFEDRKPIELRAGRFGPYLTDGELNAYIRKDEDPAALKADEVRVMLLERGKPPKAKTSSAVGSAKKTGTKKPTSKSASSSKVSSSKVSSSKAGAKKPAAKPSSSVRKPASSAARAKTVKAPPAEKSAKVDWGDLKAHLSVLTDLERKLITSIRGDGKKAEDVAPGLGLEVAKAKGMALQISKKLNQAYRAARG